MKFPRTISRIIVETEQIEGNRRNPKIKEEEKMEYLDRLIPDKKILQGTLIGASVLVIFLLLSVNLFQESSQVMVSHLFSTI